MNCLMVEIYRIFFQEKLPRVLPEMKEILHLSPSKRIGDWFLSEYKTIIRLYGFVHQPYIFLAFLTTRIFSLYFFRLRVTVEEEHILNFRKSLDIKFPWEEGPYVVKSRASLPIIDNLLGSMGFYLGATINYDPHQVISKRRHENKNKTSEHIEVARLIEEANWEHYPNKTPDNISME